MTGEDQVDVTSVSAIGGAAGSVAPLEPGGASFSAAQQVLGMSATSLRVALQSGQRLTDIAATRGLDRVTFITELANTINEDRPEFGSVLSSAMANRAAAAPASSQHPSAEIQAPATEPPAAAHPAITEMPESARALSAQAEHEVAAAPEPEADAEAAPNRSLLQQLSGMFNMSQRDLVRTWSNGATPIQIAVSRGVAPTDLLSAFEGALKQSGSPTLSSRAEVLAQSLAASPLTQGSLVSRGA